MILIVDNYSKTSHKAKVQQIADSITPCKSQIMRAFQINPDAVKFDHFSGIILSGSELSFSANIREKSILMGIFKRSPIPILGICFGHQALGVTFGGELGTYPDSAIRRDNEVTILVNDPLFHGFSVGSKIHVVESHRDYLTNLPPTLIKIATSSNCEFESIRHKTRPFWGVQFHPERNITTTTEKENPGTQVLRNFVRITKQNKW